MTLHNITDERDKDIIPFSIHLPLPDGNGSETQHYTGEVIAGHFPFETTFEVRTPEGHFTIDALETDAGVYQWITEESNPITLTATPLIGKVIEAYFEQKEK